MELNNQTMENPFGNLDQLLLDVCAMHVHAAQVHAYLYASIFILPVILQQIWFKAPHFILKSIKQKENSIAKERGFDDWLDTYINRSRESLYNICILHDPKNSFGAEESAWVYTICMRCLSAHGARTQTIAHTHTHTPGEQ